MTARHDGAPAGTSSVADGAGPKGEGAAGAPPPKAAAGGRRFRYALPGAWVALAFACVAFSPSLLNSFQVSLMNRKFVQTRGGVGENYAARLGLNGVSDAAFPTFNVAGYALLGSQAIFAALKVDVVETRQMLAIRPVARRLPAALAVDEIELRHFPGQRVGD